MIPPNHPTRLHFRFLGLGKLRGSGFVIFFFFFFQKRAYPVRNDDDGDLEDRPYASASNVHNKFGRAGPFPQLGFPFYSRPGHHHHSRAQFCTIENPAAAATTFIYYCLGTAT